MEAPLAAKETSRKLVSAIADRYEGPSAEEVTARLQRQDMTDVRAVVSWRGVIAQTDVCFVSLALKYLDLIQEESCGRCTPCRIGTDVMREILGRLRDGKSSGRDVDELRRLAQQIDESAWCGIANTIRDPILGLLDLGAQDFTAHVEGNPCPEEITYGWVAAPCRSTCPSTVDCPSYIFQAMEEHARVGADIVRRENPLPAIIGRTCPRPCESNCTLAKVGEPIAINFIKRWCADRSEGLVDVSRTPGYAGSTAAGRTPSKDLGEPAHEAGEHQTSMRSHRLSTPKKTFRDERVAIVGAGPAGLSAAYFLARRGYHSTVFESLPVPGGMVYVGIPEYRLPRNVIWRETELIEREGVEIRYNQKIGRDLTFMDLSRMGYVATFIGIGAHSGKPLKIPGEDLPGSMDAIDLLRKVSLGEKVDVGDHVLVLGGGNSAMDAARTSVRLGAKHVRIVYRRTRAEMPANPWEIEEAEEEGVEFQYLAAPVRCEGTTSVENLVCQQMELGEPDESGRRRPVPMDVAPFFLQADSVIAAVGQQPDFSPFAEDPELKLNRWGYLEADPITGMTSKPGVFVGGDAVSGGGTVIEAINAGKAAAKYIDVYLRGEPVVEDIEDKTKRIAVYLGAQKSSYELSKDVDYGKRVPMPMLPPDIRKTNFEHTELGFTRDQARSEAQRCLRCHRPILVAL